MHMYTGRGDNCGCATGLLQEDCPTFHTAEPDTGRKRSKSMFHVPEESRHSTNKILLRIQNFAIWRPSLSHCHPVETRGLLSAVSAIRLSSMSAILSIIDLPHMSPHICNNVPDADRWPRPRLPIGKAPLREITMQLFNPSHILHVSCCGHFCCPTSATRRQRYPGAIELKLSCFYAG
ncbi:hypothetical protein BD311DRAFT_522523 [Dichomitus squalens]|uniref:Uncharacterized protein n=1 Tax=Dichomitus squalens TaxID=114155 RepID=A0A4Q9MGX9_9APHY|nr:hypothetical protein BD311DRAFT_522523 [Dichomitus squalens]